LGHVSAAAGLIVLVLLIVEGVLAAPTLKWNGTLSTTLVVTLIYSAIVTTLPAPRS
jgi:hypothetical protein